MHDALASAVTYDLTADMNQSAYSALVNGKSVCAGYARAYQYLLQQLGIPCYYCTGYSGGDHAWNIVKLDDGYYNVDVTWDDANTLRYDYFNKTDADFASTHVRQNLSVYLPACNGTAYRQADTTTTGAADSGQPSQGNAATPNPKVECKSRRCCEWERYRSGQPGDGSTDPEQPGNSLQRLYQSEPSGAHALSFRQYRLRQ